MRGVEHLVTAQVDFNEAAGRHFLEQQAVGVDQEVLVRTRYPGRHVRENEIVPAKHRDQSVARGEVDTDLPFLIGYVISDVQFCGHHRPPHT